MRNFEPEYRRRIREKTENQKQDADREQRHSDDYKRVERIIDAIGTITQQREREQQHEDSERRKDRFLQVGEIAALVLAAIVGIAAIWVGNHDSSEQRLVMQGQLTEMRNQRLQTMAQTRAYVRREQPTVRALNDRGNVGSPGERLAGWAISPVFKNLGTTEAKEYRATFGLKVFDRIGDKKISDADCPERPAIDTSARGGIFAAGEQKILLAEKLSVDDTVSAQAGTKYILMWG